ncbi:unnamed protein product [Chilo suppressalis]|uniref:Insulin-like domain-containing protein n=1 Tax=Chilo suppressalis TaxID=168631 RepID=A0ABN8B053_CHISP|nr:unnamed protein product [Chilo suppressalis]
MLGEIGYKRTANTQLTIYLRGKIMRIFCGHKLTDTRVLYCYASKPNPTKGHAVFPISRIFCGRQLADTLVLYCNLSDLNPTKRYALFPELLLDVQMLGEITYKPWSIFNNALSPWPARQVSAKHTTNALTSLRPKRSPGLVDECCHKACYVSELMSYC